MGNVRFDELGCFQAFYEMIGGGGVSYRILEFPRVWRVSGISD